MKVRRQRILVRANGNEILRFEVDARGCIANATPPGWVINGTQLQISSLPLKAGDPIVFFTGIRFAAPVAVAVDASVTNQTCLLRTIGEDCITLAQLRELTLLSTEQLSPAARQLIRRGLVERLERGCFRLTETGRDALASGIEIKSGPAGLKPRKTPGRSRRPSLQQRAWNVMRQQRLFTVAELVTCAAMPGDRLPDATLRDYMRALRTSGHVMAAGSAPAGLRGRKIGRFRLVNDTGTIAPSIVRKGRAVLDHNTGEEVML